METPHETLQFARPPVDEVVLSVLFSPLDKLLAPHLGEFWKEFNQDGFVNIAEQLPVIPVVEQFPNPVKNAEWQINVPTLARILFIHEDDSQIIQVQRDRFTFNWRKTELEQQYPGFSTILKRFETFFGRYCEVVTNLGVGPVIPCQYELTYINQIFQGAGWDTLEGIGKIYNVFVDSRQSDSFWSGAESLILRTSFPVADLNGRLHLTISNRIKQTGGQQTLQTEFTLHGFPENAEHSMIAWFKSAHDEICRKFASMFTEYIQLKVWERQ